MLCMTLHSRGWGKKCNAFLWSDKEQSVSWSASSALLSRESVALFFKDRVWHQESSNVRTASERLLGMIGLCRKLMPFFRTP